MNTDSLKTIITDKRICVLIPTYNNGGTLRAVIDGVLRYTDDVIVVDDGSTDCTPDILATYGERLQVVTFSRNRGKGSALKAGFRYALQSGYDYAVTIDSDGQHYPSDLPAFVRAIVEYPGSIIIGERDLKGVDINGKSSFANRFSNFWFRLQTGVHLRDTQTGYRAYPLRRLHGLKLLTSRYEAELELLVFAAWHAVPIRPIAIQVYYPPRGERVSHFRPALDFTRISLLNTVLCFAALIYGLPVKTVNKVREKLFFKTDFRPFTHRRGERRQAAITCGRLLRSLYAGGFFLFKSLFVLTPYTFVRFKLGRDSAHKREALRRKLHRMSRYVVRHLPGCKTLVLNPEEENFERPALIICNHQSYLDLPMLMSLTPKLVFLTNDWVWNSPFFGHVIRHAEYLPVSAGVDMILPRLRDIVGRGYSVVVFPEGTRSHDGRIGRFKQGAFHLAARLGLDILPLALHGAGDFMARGESLFRRGQITLSVMGRVRHPELSDMLPREQASLFRRLITDQVAQVGRTIADAAYFRPLVFYRYAYRGWNTVSQAKQVLRQTETELIDNNDARTVCIRNSGTGVFAIWFALVNSSSEVYAFEEDVALHAIAVDTAGIPANLHFIHPVETGDYNPGLDFDRTITL